MSERKMNKIEGNVNEKGREGEGKKPGRMLEALKKMSVTPLKATIIVATSVVLAAGCGSSLTTDNRDADEDIESDAPLIAQIPRPPLDAKIPMPRDAETDGDVVEDVVEETPDVVEDTDEEEAITAMCSPVNANRSVYMGVGHTTDLGGIGTRFNGTDSSGNALFDILCGEAVVSDMIVGVGESITETLSEYGFSVTLEVVMLTDSNCRVAITVMAH